MRFIFLLIAALIAVFIAVTAVKWSENPPAAEDQIALPSWVPLPHMNRNLATSNETPGAQQEQAKQEEVKQEQPKEETKPEQPKQETKEQPSFPERLKAAVTENTQPSSEASTETVDIIAAKNTIPMGTVIDDSMIETQNVSKKELPEHYIALEPTPASGTSFVIQAHNKEITDKVIGRVARSTFQAHEPIVLSKLSDPDDRNYLANELPSGMRAITLAVDSVSGVGGYLYAGDRVDVIFTHNVPQELHAQADYKNTAFYRPVISEVIAPNVRLLAVNARSGDKKEEPVSNVTIEISDEYAQRVRLAERLGILSLSLRSTKDNNTSIPCPTYVKELSRAVDHGAPCNGPAPVKHVVTKKKKIHVVKKPVDDGSDIKIIRGAELQPCTNNPCVIH